MGRHFQWNQAIENGAFREARLSERKPIRCQDGI
jgi:hypothetical protein